MKKVYLSGAMSGKDDYNRPAFHDAAKLLKANGYRVYNPADIELPKNIDTMSELEIWIYGMKKAIAMLMKADRIIMLPGWQESKGAKIERWIAKILYYEVSELDDEELIH